jgi:hypothetical protein
MKLKLNGLARVRDSQKIGTVVLRAEMMDGRVRYGIRFPGAETLSYYDPDQIYAVGRIRLSKAQDAAMVRCASGPVHVHPSTAACLVPAGLLRFHDQRKGTCVLTEKGRAWMLENHPEVELQSLPREEKGESDD